MASYAVIVTGGIASGKSAVTSRFAVHGIEIADADQAARDAVAVGSGGLKEVIARFGEDILLEDGGLDRAKMRLRVFADADARKDLERIIHPRVRSLLLEQCTKATSPYVIAAIPLFTESGGRAVYPWADRVLVVDVSRETQAQRLMARDGADRELAAKMIDAQATRAQRLAVADDILNNDGPLESLDERVEYLHRLYLRLAQDK